MIAVPFLQLIVAMVLGTRSQNYPTDRKPPLWELAPYVVLVRFAVAFAKVWLMAVAKPPIDPIAAKERSTKSSAYSVRSWPSSSFHNFTRSRFIFFPPENLLECLARHDRRGPLEGWVVF